MSEIMQTQAGKSYRRRLLITASTAALVVFCYGAQQAQASDEDRPTVWIEGGYSFSGITGSHEPAMPLFDSGLKEAGFTSVSDLQNILSKSYGAEGGISFQPEGSDWVFSAYAKYGRANGKRRIHQEKEFSGTLFTFYNPFYGRSVVQTQIMPKGYEDVTSREIETHTIVDFQVGKDVGLGLFGRHDRATIGFGVRYAQMTATSHVQVFGRAEGEFIDLPENLIGNVKYLPVPFYHNSSILAERAGSFQGIGPSVSWKSYTSLFGDDDAGEVDFDWGINAALLFGRQKLKVHHDVADSYHYAVPYVLPSNPAKYLPHSATSTSHSAVNASHSHSVTVPNIGGFAGVSYRFTNAKVSAGYRADFYFGAMDGGFDTHRSINVGYHGPFATISIGLGG
jgi:hypothetical protein